MVSRNIIETYLHDYLQVASFHDIGVNGLQVQGKQTIKLIVTGVTICQELITKAIELKADAIFVHHGILFNSKGFVLTKYRSTHIKLLTANDINLFMYHLPLDVNDKIGNNMLLGKDLNFRLLKRIDVDGIHNILSIGEVKTEISNTALLKKIANKFNINPLYIHSKNTKLIKKVAWCTGAGQQFIEKVADEGAGAYITGEISHKVFHTIQDLDINVYAIGHHNSEKSGICMLGQHLSKKFKLKHYFIDIMNPL